MKQDPDAEVHRWTWVDTSKGLPEDIKKNLHVPIERNALMHSLGHGDDNMKNCDNLKKYMSKKGMDPNKRHDPEDAHMGLATDKYADEQVEQDGLHDKEEAKSKKATKNLGKYEKMMGKK